MPFDIYKVTNSVNGLIYVGRTVNMHKRWLKHKNEALHGSQKLLHQAMREYGIERFTYEVIEVCPDYPTMKSRELYWIRALNTFAPYGYNDQVPSLSDVEAAIVKYDAWGWTLEQYARYFGVSVNTLKALRAGASHFHVTREHLSI